jgi:hypothetical protein
MAEGLEVQRCPLRLATTSCTSCPPTHVPLLPTARMAYSHFAQPRFSAPLHGVSAT